MFESFLSFDSAVFQWVAQVFHPGAGLFWDRFFVFFTTLGDSGWFWIALGLIFLVPNKTRKVGAVMLLAMVLDVGITNGLLKHLFNRPRPFNLEQPLWWAEQYIYPGLIKKPESLSFPSGHAAASFAGGVSWLLAARKPWVSGRARAYSLVGIVIAVLIAFSRVYVGVHYPTDVLAGVLTGAICAVLAFLLFRKLEPGFDKINASVVRFFASK
ncbi:MAG: phosphatase PAP2 family protein [Oscillospiraceae bacterium]|jgi:undecaprenyl-diphosphatase|nr:phosphatase PAP2 family protein [Oscillospiraceae bacterium]